MRDSELRGKADKTRYRGLDESTPGRQMLAFAIGELGRTAVARECQTTARAVAWWCKRGVPPGKEAALRALCECLSAVGRERVTLAEDADEGPAWPFLEDMPPLVLDELATSQVRTAPAEDLAAPP